MAERESSFGHVSVRVDETSYSFGPGGMAIEGAASFNAKVTRFRSGSGLLLDLSPNEEADLVKYLTSSGVANKLLCTLALGMLCNCDKHERAMVVADGVGPSRVDLMTRALA